MEFRRVALLLVFSSLALSLTILPMDTPGTIKAAKKVARWTRKIGDMLLGQQPIGNMQAQLIIPNDPFPFSDLPKDMQKEVILSASIYDSTLSLQQAAQMISNLAQTNHFLNDLINEPSFCLKLIKRLAKKFNCSDFDVSAVLKVKQAKNQHDLQQQLLNLCTNRYSLNSANLGINLVQLINQGVDVNYTYHVDQTPALIIATYINPAMAFHLLDAPEIDPELATIKGITPLIAAEEEQHQNKDLIARIKEAIHKKKHKPKK